MEAAADAGSNLRACVCETDAYTCTANGDGHIYCVPSTYDMRNQQKRTVANEITEKSDL